MGTRNRVAEIQTFGIAATQTLRRLENQSTADGSILASASHFSYDTRIIFSGRSNGFGFIGGGSAGFEGGIELPKGEFGYQVLSPTVLFELAGTAGPVLAGRYNVDDAPARPLGGLLQVGGHAAFGLPYMHLELAVNRFDSGDNELDPLTEVAGALCGLPSVFAVCANARHFAGGANAQPDMRIAYLGIHIGVVTSGDPGNRTNRNGERTPR